MSRYECGTDRQGDLRVLRVPSTMSDEEARELVEAALDPPYGVVYPITVAELRQLAKER